MGNHHVRPFLKWAGGKYRSLDRIKSLLPPGDRLVEPFVGAGAVFLNTDYQRYLLCDINADLIDVWRHLAEGGETFVEQCAEYFHPLFNNEGTYRFHRDEFSYLGSCPKKSALFIYLNRHGFNGLCRYNKRGRFNVPFGRYESPYFPLNEMHFFLKKSRNCEIVCQDYQEVLPQCRAGDVVYCDPPYAPIGDKPSFTAYDKSGFTLGDQEDLSGLSRAAAQRGATVILSNHSTEWVRNIYRGAQITEFFAGRSISCKGDRREPVKELLAVFDSEHLSNIPQPYTPAIAPAPSPKSASQAQLTRTERMVAVLNAALPKDKPYQSSDIEGCCADIGEALSHERLISLLEEGRRYGFEITLKGVATWIIRIEFAELWR